MKVSEVFIGGSITLEKTLRRLLKKNVFFPSTPANDRPTAPIRPLWRDELSELTGYTVEDIVECGEELWNLYEEMFPSHRVSVQK